jgi:hypothetical protein
MSTSVEENVDVIHAREATMRTWHAYFDEFEDFRWEVELLIGVEDRVFLRVRERGRAGPSIGRPPSRHSSTYPRTSVRWS